MAVHVVFICSDAHKCFTQLTMKTKCELLFTGTRYIDMVCFHLSDDRKNITRKCSVHFVIIIK